MRKYQTKVHSHIQYIILYGQATKNWKKKKIKLKKTQSRREKSELRIREKSLNAGAAIK